MLTRLTVVSILQHTHISDQHAVHFKLIQYYIYYNSVSPGKQWSEAGWLCDGQTYLEVGLDNIGMAYLL